MPITFDVSTVSRATLALRMPQATGAARIHDQPVDAMGSSSPAFVPAREHGLVQAVHTAYALHYPLILTPDALWLAIAQGFAVHVQANSERLRGKFVRHEGKVKITIERHDFVRGSPDNRWAEVLDQFSDAIASHVGRQRDLVLCDFTTTGPCERAASEIVLLDALQSYFDYEVLTLCGIPEITLEGTADDWRAICRRACALDEYELGWWTEPLLMVLDKLAATAEGEVDVAFWRRFFKHEDGSGGPWVRGWINVLFPYVRRGGMLVRNDQMTGWEEKGDEPGGGSLLTEIPSGVSMVPFQWRHLGEVLGMEFLGGFVGVAQDGPTLGVRPAIGWAVRETRGATDTEHQEIAREVRLPSEATLIAGVVTDPVALTEGEADALCANVERIATASGIRIACVPAGEVSGNMPSFPEFPYPLRLVVGIRVTAINRAAIRNCDVAELRRALDAASAIPEGTWRTISEALPAALQGAPAVYLAISGRSRRAMLQFGDGQAPVLPVAEAKTSGPAVVRIDTSPVTHAERQRLALDGGVSPDHATYMLRIA